MTIHPGERVCTYSRSIFGTLVAVDKHWATVQTDDGQTKKVRPYNVRRMPSTGFRPRVRKVEDESQYPPQLVALAKANGVSAKLAAEWLRK